MIDQKAREIAAQMATGGDVWGSDVERVLAGIIEGLEMALAIYDGRKYGGFDQVADAIRALIEEQKV